MIVQEEAQNLLRTGAARLGIPLSSDQIALFLIYLTELVRWNQKVNLTGLRDEREIVIKGFLDSLTPLTVLNRTAEEGTLDVGERWIDIGSGAGFPGLVLKIARPGLQMTLVEAVEKKAAFLHHIIGRLGLVGVTVVCDRMERLTAPKWKGSFDLLTTRAVSPEFVLEKGRLLVRSGGRILFFQAHEDRRIWEERLQAQHGIALEKVQSVALPFSENPRSLVLLRVG